MPFTHRIFSQKQVIVVKADGAITIQSSVNAMRDLVNDPDFDSQFPIIVDLRNMDYAPTPSDMFGIKDSLISLTSYFRSEITIVTTPNILFMARIICTMATVYKIKMTAVTESELLDSLDSQMT